MGKKLTKNERNWILYDVGNSAFTLLIATILPDVYKRQDWMDTLGLSAPQTIEDVVEIVRQFIDCLLYTSRCV